MYLSARSLIASSLKTDLIICPSLHERVLLKSIAFIGKQVDDNLYVLIAPPPHKAHAAHTLAGHTHISFAFVLGPGRGCRIPSVCCFACPRAAQFNWMEWPVFSCVQYHFVQCAMQCVYSFMASLAFFARVRAFCVGERGLLTERSIFANRTLHISFDTFDQRSEILCWVCGIVFKLTLFTSNG